MLWSSTETRGAGKGGGLMMLVHRRARGEILTMQNHHLNLPQSYMTFLKAETLWSLQTTIVWALFPRSQVNKPEMEVHGDIQLRRKIHQDGRYMTVLVTGRRQGVSRRRAGYI
jgi:hypothetical protein